MASNNEASRRNARTSNQAELTRINNGIAIDRGGKLNRAQRRAASRASRKKSA